MFAGSKSTNVSTNVERPEILKREIKDFVQDEADGAGFIVIGQQDY